MMGSTLMSRLSSLICLEDLDRGRRSERRSELARGTGLVIELPPALSVERESPFMSCARWEPFH